MAAKLHEKPKSGTFTCCIKYPSLYSLFDCHTPLFLCPCRNQSTAAMAVPPTSQTDTTPFQVPAYFSASTPPDEGNPFAFVSKTTQEPQEPFTGYYARACSGPAKDIQSETAVSRRTRTNQSGYSAASFFDSEPPPGQFQSNPPQGSHHMPRGPPVPSQGSPNPLESPAAQASVLPPPTHEALESHYSQPRVTLPLHTLLPSQGPPQNSQMSQGPPPSQMLSYPPQMDPSSPWEQNRTAARPPLEFQGEYMYM